MKKENTTCIQRARFFLYFTEQGEWRRNEKTPLKKFTKLKKVTPDDIRTLGDAYFNRIRRVADIVQLLTSIHDDWAITPKKDCVLMETTTMDFEEIIDILLKHGYTEDDYVLLSEYTRKWGMI